ncbi:hypothetical protein BDF20DRAFT_915764 [Mycotypha africana]|uniref:uncharacterized protein n=1 Tax=Mycotypha africana TaxID=64632 RepID=UPI0022FFC8DD|nr:uncharacterized protein BDF20DRAFT_915764 [Mycotypha africana]KAI8972028.1 hypothetical protein BDF20DRAFT_915764 [Mycotypha africana]
MPLDSDKTDSVIAKLVQQQKNYNKLFLTKEKSAAAITVITETNINSGTNNIVGENSGGNNNNNNSNDNSNSNSVSGNLFLQFLRSLPFVNLLFVSVTNSNKKEMQPTRTSTTAAAEASSKASTTVEKQKRQSSVLELNVIHDEEKHLFMIEIDKNTTAALCYLPTRVEDVLEVYHIEIPSIYRNNGLGDRLVCQCLKWAELQHKLIIPNTHFMKQYLTANEVKQKYDHIIVKNEDEGRARMKQATTST